MRRFGNLFPQVIDYANLQLAAEKAQRCKRYRGDVLEFNYEQERNLHRLREELADRTYRPGGYRNFTIYEPKRRLISAAPYRDRVVHHALCNVIEPIFERTFIASCYANRMGKGTHKALDHYVALTRRFRYVLRADIEKYFPTIDHELLKETIRRKIKCPDTLWLIELILDHAPETEAPLAYFAGDDLIGPAQRRRGLPIGNLTSQLWANVLLNDLDHRMAGRFGGRRYVRYVDDFALFSDDREELQAARAMMAKELSALRLRLHPAKTRIVETGEGANFLGFFIRPRQIRIRQENLKRARRRFRELQWAYRQGQADLETVGNSVRSWAAHAAYGNTVRLRAKVFGSLAFARN